MGMNVYAADANPAVDRRLYPLSKCRALQEVAVGISRLIMLADGRCAIQRLEAPCVDVSGEPIGRSNLVPFGRASNPLFPPSKLHYEIPHAGDATPFLRHRRTLIEVSSRGMFSQPGVQWANYCAI